MIDLTKPIRIKKKFAKASGWSMDSHEPVTVTRGVSNWLIESQYTYGGWLVAESERELESAVENIPEPRKPARWVVSETSRIGMPIDKDWTPMVPCVYLIEWPKHAPLPDWPEGYT